MRSSRAFAIHSGAFCPIISMMEFTWKQSPWICLSHIGKTSLAVKFGRVKIGKDYFVEQCICYSGVHLHSKCKMESIWSIYPVIRLSVIICEAIFSAWENTSNVNKIFPTLHDSSNISGPFQRESPTARPILRTLCCCTVCWRTINCARSPPDPKCLILKEAEA